MKSENGEKKTAGGPYKVTDKEGREWYAVDWRGEAYTFGTYGAAFRFYAELRYETLYGALKPQVSFS